MIKIDEKLPVHNVLSNNQVKIQISHRIVYLITLSAAQGMKQWIPNKQQTRKGVETMHGALDI
jgi:hypothetical protein